MNLQTSNYYGSDLEAMSNAKNYSQWILEEFADYLRGHIAEVGAGNGNFTEYLLQTPVDNIELFEPSQNMYPLLTRKFSLNSRVTTHNCCFSKMEAKLDAVVYCNVMEHIADDLGEMLTVHDSLKPGGHLLLFVPALRFLFSRMDREVGHYRRYHKKELVSKIHRAGLKLVKAKYFDLLGIIPWYIFFVLLKSSYTRGNVSLYDKVGVPITKLFEAQVSPPFGKNLLVVAERQ